MKIMNYFRGLDIFIEKLEIHDFFNNLQIYSVRDRLGFINGGYLEKETLNPQLSVNFFVS